jgi:hypothetical protein
LKEEAIKESFDRNIEISRLASATADRARWVQAAEPFESHLLRWKEAMRRKKDKQAE